MNVILKESSLSKKCNLDSVTVHPHDDVLNDHNSNGSIEFTSFMFRN